MKSTGILVPRAQPNYTGHEVPDLVIKTADPDDSGARTPDEWRAYYQGVAHVFVNGLGSSLPQGLIDAILTELLIRRGVSTFVVQTDTYGEQNSAIARIKAAID